MEEKELILQEVRRLKIVVDESNRLQGEIDNYESKLPIFSNIDSKGKIAIFLMLFFVSALLHINLYFLVPILLILSYFIFISPKMYLKRNEDEYNLNKSKLEECNKNLNADYIPDEYIEEYALKKLELYLINKRADTLKEALNIFEQEKRDNQRIEEIKKLQQLQEKTYEKIYDTGKL